MKFAALPDEATVNEAVQQWLDAQSDQELERVLGELRNYTWCDASGAIARLESALATRRGQLQ